LSLADIEWVILPAVVNGQFYVVESLNEETGFRAPVAVATWAFVSEEADHRLQSNLTQHARLRPDEWRSGEIGWIVDLVGDLRGTQAAAEWLRAGLFKERDAKIVLTDETSTKRLSSLHVVTRKSRGHE
jgi:cytolysin-activating lysine-acyltransferase